MAIIKCPECGKEVSDKAKACPNCGCPIELISPSGTVKIKMSPVKSPTGFNGSQSVSVYANNDCLWEGNVGTVAEIHLEQATTVTIKYHMSAMHYGGECSGTIDPVKSRKYNVQARQGFFSTKLSLSEVDVFDSN